MMIMIKIKDNEEEKEMKEFIISNEREQIRVICCKASWEDDLMRRP